MRDPVALAWSGRIEEARELAVKQAKSDDPFLAGQGLEALAVLGREHRLRADAAIEQLLVERAQEGAAVARRAFEAAMGLESRALESAAAEFLRRGEARWEVLRYAGELPSHALAQALAQGWAQIPAKLRDEALLTTCAMPCANAPEAAAWGERALKLATDPDEAVRVAAFTALRVWCHEPAARACAAALGDESILVRREAARALAAIDPELLYEQAVERGAECPEAVAALTPAQQEKLRKRRH